MTNSCVSKPVFVLSGMSGVGKSCIVEESRMGGCLVLKSHTKFLLDTDFGYGVPTNKFPLMDCFMQVRHIADFGIPRDKVIVVERSVIDHYYFNQSVGRGQSDKSDEDCMLLKISNYFDLLTEGGTRQLHIVDIRLMNEDWIAKSIKNQFRSILWATVDWYLKSQDKYKRYFFDVLDTLNLNYVVEPIVIEDRNLWTPDIRRDWVSKHILKFV